MFRVYDRILLLHYKTAKKFEAFLRDFQRKNASGTAKIPSRSDLEWDFRRLHVHALDRA